MIFGIYVEQSKLLKGSGNTITKAGMWFSHLCLGKEPQSRDVALEPAKLGLHILSPVTQIAEYVGWNSIRKKKKKKVDQKICLLS